MLLSVAVVGDGRVGSLNSTSLLPVDSLSAYRACDSAAWFPRGIRDGIFVVGGCRGLFSVQVNLVAGLPYVLGKLCMPILGTGCCVVL